MPIDGSPASRAMTDGHLIGLDYGSESARGGVVDVRTGKVVGSHAHPYRHGVMVAALPDGTALPPGWALQDAADYEEAAAEILPALGRGRTVRGIGLGFTGWYAGQPEYLRKKMLEGAPRIRHLIESDTTVRVCPEAYGNVDTRDLVEPPSSKMVVILIIFLAFMLTTLACNFFLFQQASTQLTSALSEIIAHDKELGP